MNFHRVRLLLSDGWDSHRLQLIVVQMKEFSSIGLPIIIILHQNHQPHPKGIGVFQILKGVPDVRHRVGIRLGRMNRRGEKTSVSYISIYSSFTNSPGAQWYHAIRTRVWGSSGQHPGRIGGHRIFENQRQGIPLGVLRLQPKGDVTMIFPDPRRIQYSHRRGIVVIQMKDYCIPRPLSPGVVGGNPEHNRIINTR